jgi:hypothetical protein
MSSQDWKLFSLIFFQLASLETVTEPFGDKTDVVAKHWKTHVAEERSDIVSELACMGLAHLEEWHYSVFDSSGTCSLGLISTESTPNPTGKGHSGCLDYNKYSAKQTLLYKTVSVIVNFLI